MIEPGMTPMEEAIWAAVFAGEVVRTRAASERFGVKDAARAANFAVTDLRILVAEDAAREAAKTPPAMPAMPAKAKR